MFCYSIPTSPYFGIIGYGGNVAREVVKANAAWFVTDFQDLINVLTD